MFFESESNRNIGKIYTLVESDVDELFTIYPDLTLNTGDLVIITSNTGYAEYTYKKIKYWEHHSNGMVCYGLDDSPEFKYNAMTHEVFQVSDNKLYRLRNGINFCMSYPQRTDFFALLWSLV